MERRIAPGDVEISREHSGVFIEYAIGPNAGGEPVRRTERLQCHQRRCELQVRCGIELVVLSLTGNHPPIESLDEHALVSIKRTCCFTCFRRSEEHTSELQSPCNLVCRLL